MTFARVLYLVTFTIFSCTPLAVYSLSTPAKPVQKIAIIGSGISGLGVAHALDSLSTKADDFEISVFDARKGLNTQDGAGIQINGGLKALGMMNKDLQQAVIDAGLPMVGIESRTKAWENPSSTNFDTLLKLDVPKLIRNAGGKVSKELVQGDQILWFAIMRGALQEVLSEKLPPKISGNLQFGKKLSGIITSDEGPGVHCRFADDSTYGPFDLVIGCDGVKSAVREYINSGSIEGGQGGIYSGIRIKWAVKDGDPNEDKDIATSCTLTQYFGDGGYALDGIYGSGKNRLPTKSGLLVYLDERYIGPFKKKENSNGRAIDENVDWAQDNRQPLQEGRQKLLQELKQFNIPDFNLAPSVAGADRLFDLGVYFHNPFNRWSKEIADGLYAVLCGDAAHAMPPFLGQGANQALQDAYTLASKICEYNAFARDDAASSASEGEDDKDVSLREFLKEYENTRWFPTFNIFFKSAVLGYLEVGGFDGFYSKFRDVFFKTMGFIGVARKVLIDAAIPKL